MGARRGLAAGSIILSLLVVAGTSGCLSLPVRADVRARWCWCRGFNGAAGPGPAGARHSPLGCIAVASLRMRFQVARYCSMGTGTPVVGEP